MKEWMLCIWRRKLDECSRKRKISILRVPGKVHGRNLPEYLNKKRGSKMSEEQGRFRIGT